MKVLSENEMLTERGERVHTGDSDELTKRFAESFTKHFDKLAAKYPIYAELRNVFDLALVAAVIQSHDLPGQVGWHMTHFGPGGDYSPSSGHGADGSRIGDEPSRHRRQARHGRGQRRRSRRDAAAWPAADAVKTDTYGLMAGERRTSTAQGAAAASLVVGLSEDQFRRFRLICRLSSLHASSLDELHRSWLVPPLRRRPAG